MAPATLAVLNNKQFQGCQNEDKSYTDISYKKNVLVTSVDGASYTAVSSLQEAKFKNCQYESISYTDSSLQQPRFQCSEGAKLLFRPADIR